MLTVTSDKLAPLVIIAMDDKMVPDFKGLAYETVARIWRLPPWMRIGYEECFAAIPTALEGTAVPVYTPENWEKMCKLSEEVMKCSQTPLCQNLRRIENLGRKIKKQEEKIEEIEKDLGALRENLMDLIVRKARAEQEIEGIWEQIRQLFAGETDETNNRQRDALGEQLAQHLKEKSVWVTEAGNQAPLVTQTEGKLEKAVKKLENYEAKLTELKTIPEVSNYLTVHYIANYLKSARA